MRGVDNDLDDRYLDEFQQDILAYKFNKLIEQRGLTPTEAAAITGMTKSNISHIRRGKRQKISRERLEQALASLERHVESGGSPCV